MLKALLLLLWAALFLVGAESARPEGRIVAGRDSSIVRHPHQVSLRHRSCETCAYTHLCGGSIYRADIIVTAAHCLFYREAGDFVVVAGSDRRGGGDGFIARLEKYVLHERYNASTTDYDAAIVLLASPLPINNVTTATVSLAAQQPAPGVASTVTGWGAISEGGSPAQTLQEITVPIIGSDECDRAYGGSGRITESMLCARANGPADTCTGDSGGPLLVGGQLAGIVSWGFGCSRQFPGVYANVAFLRDWFEATIAEQSRK